MAKTKHPRGPRIPAKFASLEEYEAAVCKLCIAGLTLHAIAIECDSTAPRVKRILVRKNVGRSPAGNYRWTAERFAHLRSIAPRGQMASALSKWRKSTSRNTIIRKLDRLVRQHAIGDLAGLERRAGVHRATIWGWRVGGTEPTLFSLQAVLQAMGHDLRVVCVDEEMAVEDDV